MATKSLSRTYRFTDAHLITLANDKLDLAQRDATEFVDRGYDSNRLASIQQLKQDFINIPSDRVLDAYKCTATQNKLIARDALETYIRRVQMAAQHGLENSANLVKFGTSAIARLSDDTLFLHAKDALSAAQEHLLELSNEGFNAAKLNTFESLITAFREAQLAQSQAVHERSIACANRITLGNSLYEAIVKICDIGKDIWYAENAAKYNHYVLYPYTKPKKAVAKPEQTPTERAAVSPVIETPASVEAKSPTLDIATVSANYDSAKTKFQATEQQVLVVLDEQVLWVNLSPTAPLGEANILPLKDGINETILAIQKRATQLSSSDKSA